jgi:hypothetical protein
MMDGARFTIDHIAVTLPGVAAGDAAGIERTLEAALIEQLGGWRPDLAGAGSLALGDVDLGSAVLARRLDGATLAEIIADRLVGWLDGAIARAKETA